MKLRHFLIGGFAALLVGQASAEDGNNYVGLSWMADYQYTADSTGTKISNGGSAGYLAKLGHNYSDNFGLEAQVLRTPEVSTDDGDYQVNALGGVFMRGNLPLMDDRMRLYVLGGVSLMHTSVDDGTSSETDLQGGVSYGGGIELYGNETTALTAEFVQYVDQGNYGLKSWNIGFVNRF